MSEKDESEKRQYTLDELDIQYESEKDECIIARVEVGRSRFAVAHSPVVSMIQSPLKDRRRKPIKFQVEPISFLWDLENSGIVYRFAQLRRIREKSGHNFTTVPFMKRSS